MPPGLRRDRLRAVSAATEPGRQLTRSLRARLDDLHDAHAEALIAGNCDLRTEVEQLRARLADIGSIETEWAVLWRDRVRQEYGAHEQDARDISAGHGPRVRLQRRLVGRWRDADDAAGEEGGRDG